MDDFDPVPKLNPMVRGLLTAALIMGLVLVVYGMVAIATALLVALPR